MTERLFRISGRVQGVGFRWWTRREAGALGIRGWVKNLPDGSVAVRAEGPPEKVQALRDALARGPAGARVDRVEEEEHPSGSPAWREPAGSAFEIR